MENFWDSNVWGTLLLIALLLSSLLAGNVVRKTVPFLRNSLIPTSVLGGIILILVDLVYKAFTGVRIVDAPVFGGNGTATLEMMCPPKSRV